MSASWSTEKLLKTIKLGVDAWNRFRRQNPTLQPNLQGVDLAEFDLRNYNFSNTLLNKANLAKAELSKANLRKANLSHADLSHVQLVGADLTDAKLFHAKMAHANLTRARGLWTVNLGGAQLHHAQLPENIKFEDVQDRVAEVSKNARNLFFIFLVSCIFCFLSMKIASVDLIKNTGVTKLPIIGADLLVKRFFIYGPLLIFAMFLFFQFYLRDLWRSMAFLPAIGPAGRQIDQLAYPWLFNSLVRSHNPFLGLKNDIIFQIRKFLCMILGWFLGPGVLGFFWLYYLPRHDLWITVFHIFLFQFAFGLALHSYSQFWGHWGRTEENVSLFTKFMKAHFYVLYGFSVLMIGFSCWMMLKACCFPLWRPPWAVSVSCLRVCISKRRDSPSRNIPSSTWISALSKIGTYPVLKKV